MITETKEILDSIERIIEEANKHRKNYFFLHYQKESLGKFIEAINPHFPLDSVDVLDLAFAVAQNGHFPDAGAIKILEDIIKEGEFYKSIRWKYRHPVLTAQISVEGAYYEIHFSGKNGATTFPITVTVDIYADMDDLENHGDECPQHFDEDDPEYSGECNCETFIVRTEKETFEHRDEFKEIIGGWLYNAHYGIKEE